MARLRRLYGVSADPDHDDFDQRLEQAELKQFVFDKAATWLQRCACPREAHDERCEVGLVIRNCDVLGETVEAEFERIQRWYWNPRFAADPGIKALILNYRTPGKERAESKEEHS